MEVNKIGICFELKFSNKEEFLDLVNDLKEKIEEVEKAIDKINGFELKLDMESRNKKGNEQHG